MRISDLILKHITGSITEDEKKELKVWIEEDPEHERVFRGLTDMSRLRELHLRYDMIDTTRPKRDGQRRIDEMKTVAEEERSRRRRVPAFLWLAASVVALVGVGAWLMTRDDVTLTTPVQPQIAQIQKLDDIKPGEVKATLTSSKGETVALDANDSVMPQVITEIKAAATENSRETTELCLDVPRGGEFKIMLEDSTVVWLNSESTLRYPEVFSDTNRRVQLSGEAYFEVKKDTKRPFLVESDGQTVRVLGTEFNIKAYPDDNLTYTTLESGSIALYSADRTSGELIISPGHQSLLDRNKRQIDTKTVRTDVITSWRHGRFVFQDLPLKAIMKDLSRWYDFEYEFTDPKVGDIVFIGSIPRYSDFATAAAILEESGGIRFEITDSKVRIAKKR